MAFLQEQAKSGLDSSSRFLTEERRRFRFQSAHEAEEFSGRHEPQVLAERSAAKDPYGAWLAQREAERELERESRPQIRLVHRPRGPVEQAIRARRL